MRKTPEDPTPTPVAELMGDPVVEMLMKADNITEHELAALIRAVASKLENSRSDVMESEDDLQMPRDYRPGVGIMLLNRNNRVFVGGRCKPKGLAWQMPQGHQSADTVSAV